MQWLVSTNRSNWSFCFASHKQFYLHKISFTKLPLRAFSSILIYRCSTFCIPMDPIFFWLSDYDTCYPIAIATINLSLSKLKLKLFVKYLPHQWLKDSAFKAGRRDVPGSTLGHVCRLSRSEFSVVFSETCVEFLRKTPPRTEKAIVKTIVLNLTTNQPPTNRKGIKSNI